MQCTFRITSPRPEDSRIGKYYLSENYISHAAAAKSIFDRIYLIARKYALKTKQRLIEQNSIRTKNNLLDYGCGTGSFLNHMRHVGWNVEGVEPSEIARTIIKKQSHINVSPDIESITKNNFDVITLWHVLEHVSNLDYVLQQLYLRLSDHGIIIVAVPNHKSWDGEKYQQHWAGYDVPRHLWHFSQQTMNSIVAKNGLKIEQTLPMKLDAYYISLLSEKYKTGASTIGGAINALINGFRSNITARKNNEYSSLIYILKK
jgi:2-polyprenyl-3-methyl-5-hydroxy-6-metoxy-1,4-benzoquinol methylase